MRHDRQPSTVMVTPLDLSSVKTAAAEWKTKHREIDGESAVTAMRAGKFGIVDTPEGLYALCTEGVGNENPITDDNPLEIDLWVERYADTTTDFISMFPSCTTSLGPDEIRALATGEPVALHDFIRSFGSRLESNYSAWKRLLEKQSVTA